jgi:hypothetical protein
MTNPDDPQVYYDTLQKLAKKIEAEPSNDAAAMFAATAMAALWVTLDTLIKMGHPLPKEWNLGTGGTEGGGSNGGGPQAP